MNNDVDSIIASVLAREASISDPIRYARTVQVIKSGIAGGLRDMLGNLPNTVDQIRLGKESLEAIAKRLGSESYNRSAQRTQQMTFGEPEDMFKGAGASSFGPVSILLQAYTGMEVMYDGVIRAVDLMNGANVVSFDDTMDQLGTEVAEAGLKEETAAALLKKLGEGRGDALRELALEQQLNRGATSSFVAGVHVLLQAPAAYDGLTRQTAQAVSNYFQLLRKRHADGHAMVTATWRDPDPVLTDLALLVWNNIDKMGEIDHGSSREDLTAFTVQRLADLCEAIRNPVNRNLLLEPIAALLQLYGQLHETLDTLSEVAKICADNIGIDLYRLSIHRKSTGESYRTLADELELLDFSQIQVRPGTKMLSRTDLFAQEHLQTSLSAVAECLWTGDDLKAIVEQVLTLKMDERKFLYDTNGFFVCKIGTGNQFGGEAPGALEVIPGERPNVSLENIWGSGYADLRDFVEGQKDATEWGNLFLITSPSGSTDKNNILLVGPQGCGKTQVMRAMATHEDSISIFAVGSDFLTCWMGEAQKNPKRLFDHAIKIRKQSGKQVHILIDEIDMVLSDQGDLSRRVDLSLEFQNLMDGVVAYPGITIWGATNHPQRIPTPMLRRFSRVEIVGEMTLEDRTNTLRHYIENFLPVEDGLDQHYELWAELLEGACGDVIRKVIDEVWLTMMRNYIVDHTEHAKEAVAMLDGMNVFDLQDGVKATVMAHVAEKTCVTPDLVEAALTSTLGNAAIRQQINVCRTTYAQSHQMFTRGQAVG